MSEKEIELLFTKFTKVVISTLEENLDAILDRQLDEKLDVLLDKKLDAMLDEKLDILLDKKLDAMLDEKLDILLDKKLDAMLDKKLDSTLDSKLDRRFAEFQLMVSRQIDKKLEPIARDIRRLQMDIETCLRPMIKILSENYLALREAISKANRIGSMEDDMFALKRVVWHHTEQLQNLS